MDDFLDKIADETIAITEEEVLEYISQKHHPALGMPPLF
jgi:acetyl-CoA synthase